MIKNSSASSAVTGTFVTPLKHTGEIVRFTGTVFIKNGIISNIVRHELKDSSIPEEVKKADWHITVKEPAVIYPGLADLHTHYDYNLLPIWQRPKKARIGWDNRFEWRACDEYAKQLKAPFRILQQQWNREFSSGGKVGDLFLFLSEIQAIAGGTTLLQEPDVIDKPERSVSGENNCLDDMDFDPSYCTYSFMEGTNGTVKRSHLLLRSTGCVDDLGIDDRDECKIRSEIQFFTPFELSKNSEGKVNDPTRIYPPQNTDDFTLTTNAAYEQFLDTLKGKIPRDEDSYGYLVHIAEGRSGCLKPGGRGMDGYSRKEFERLKKDVLECCKGARKDALKKHRLGIIHGCGIDLNKDEDFKFLKDNGISLIWSPVSNLLLYDDTPEFYNDLYRRNALNDVNLCLGSDWSPSGSKHVFDEGRFAADYLIGEGKVKSDDIRKDVFKMMTLNPAKLLGSKTGTIEAGMFADLFVLGEPKMYGAANSGDDIMSQFFCSDDSDTKLVIIGGNVIFGEHEYFDITGNESYQSMHSAEGSQYDKCVYVPKELNINLAEAMKSAQSKLKNIKISHFMACDDKEYARQIKMLRDKFIKS